METLRRDCNACLGQPENDSVDEEDEDDEDDEEGSGPIVNGAGGHST